jgi:hypothetical protein
MPMDSLTQTNGLKPSFRISCEARDAGSLHVATDHVSFTLAQRVRFEDAEQLWESVQLHCQKEDDGSLTVQILLWDPKLEDALQIAFLRSRPDETSANCESLEFDLIRKKLD